MTALADARAGRDAGMEAAAEAQSLVQPAYATQLAAAILAVAKRQQSVHVDDVLPLVRAKPEHPNVAGKVWRDAIADGVIAKTGRTRPCATDRRKHAHDYPVYRSMLFGRAAVATVPGRRAPRPAGPPGQQDLFAGGAS